MSKLRSRLVWKKMGFLKDHILSMGDRGVVFCVSDKVMELQMAQQVGCTMCASMSKVRLETLRKLTISLAPFQRATFLAGREEHLSCHSIGSGREAIFEHGFTHVVPPLGKL